MELRSQPTLVSWCNGYTISGDRKNAALLCQNRKKKQKNKSKAPENTVSNTALEGIF